MAQENEGVPAPQSAEVRFFIEKKQQIPSLPDVADKTKINVRYPLIPPFAYARIFLG